MANRISSFHVGVAAEAFVAAQFARCGYDVSVQYGANQPEYDLMIAKNDKLMKISVKGSQDGAWGLTQGFLKKADYHRAANEWLNKHNKKTVFAFVQFKGVPLNESPRLYLALPAEIADVLKSISNGRGDSVLYEYIEWGKKANGYGTVDKIPAVWKFSPERIEQILEQI